MAAAYRVDLWHINGPLLTGPNNKKLYFNDFLESNGGLSSEEYRGVLKWIFTDTATDGMEPRGTKWSMTLVMINESMCAYQLRLDPSSPPLTEAQLKKCLNFFAIHIDEIGIVPGLLQVLKYRGKRPKPVNDPIAEIIINGSESPCLLIIFATTFKLARDTTRGYRALQDSERGSHGDDEGDVAMVPIVNPHEEPGGDDPAGPMEGWNPAFVQELGKYLYDNCNLDPGQKGPFDNIYFFQPKTVPGNWIDTDRQFDTGTAKDFQKIADLYDFDDDKGIALEITRPQPPTSNAEAQAYYLFKGLFSYLADRTGSKARIITDGSDWDLPRHSFFVYGVKEGKPLYMHVKINALPVWQFYVCPSFDTTVPDGGDDSAIDQMMGASMRAPFDWALTAVPAKSI